MLSALTLKELRETAGIAALGLAALLLVALTPMRLSPLPAIFAPVRGGEIPFLSDSFLFQFVLAAGGLAIALGFCQAVRDFAGNAQHFLLHRPISRQQIYVAKLAVGLAIYFTLTGLSVLLFALWAATPGTHASPFAWSMTLPAWTAWLAISAVYLGAFLSGLRPAAWLGTRLAPLAGACGLAVVAASVSNWSALVTWPLLVGLDVVLIALIFHVARERDFA
jgi:hypothetical protein